MITGDLLKSTLRVATPLIFAAMGGMLSERAGVINIALEGMMLIGAFGAAVGTVASHSPWLGSACGMGAGAALAAVYALFVIRLRANQIVAGTAINMLALGLTPFLCKILYDVTGQTPAIPLAERFASAPLYLCWVVVAICWLGMKHTPAGLWVNFAGENPGALDAAGIRVNRIRWLAVLASGALAGMGGATLSGGVLSLLVVARHDRGPRLHGIGCAHLRQMAARARGHGVPSLRVYRSRRRPLARRRPGHPRRVHPDSSLRRHHSRPRRLRRPIPRPQSAGDGLCAEK